MRLQYEISTTGQQQLRTVFRGIEREAAASNRRMAAGASQVAKQSAREAAGPMFGPGRREQMAAIRATERAAIQSARNEARERLRQERELNRAKDSLDRQRSRAMMTRYNAEQREQRRAIGERVSLQKRIGRGLATSVGSGIGRVASIGGTAATVLGGIGIAGALTEQTGIRRRAAALANQVGDPTLKNQLALDSTKLKGFTGQETLSALSSFYTPTGDLGTGRKISDRTSRLALATGTDFDDLMSTAGQAFNVLQDQISDPIQQVNELNDILGVLAQQGSMGSVEISDLAQDFGKLGAATRAFEGGAPELLRTMGAFAQIATKRGGAESSSDASTAAMRLAGDIVTHKAKFAKILGAGNLKSKVDPTKLRRPEEIMLDVLDKTGGDIEKTSGLFGIESGKIFRGLSATYSQAERTKKGSGREAAAAELKRFTGARLSEDDINIRAASALEEPNLVFKENMKAFNTAVGTQLLPALTALVPSLTQLAPQVGSLARHAGDFISWFSRNPLSGIGAVVLASVAKDIAASGIQSGVSSLVGGMSAAQMGMAKLAGASMFAAAAWYAAYEQNEGLKQQTGGLGILDLAWGSLSSGFDKGFFEQADENLNKQAKEEAARRKIEAPGTVAANGGATGATSTGTSPAAPGSVPVVPGGAGLDKSAAALERAAGALEKAAGSMPKGGGRNPPDPSRTAPIISPSRG